MLAVNPEALPTVFEVNKAIASSFQRLE